MLEIVQQTIEFYTRNLRVPTVEELNLKDKSLQNERGSFFVTIYLKWEVRWWAGNISEIKGNAIEELIENTISAISKDSRFKQLSMSEAKEIKIRVDRVSSREILKNKKISNLDPAISWVIVIKKDYRKVATILPNINPKLFTGNDFIPVLLEKLNEKTFNENDYIVYEIKTKVETDY